MLKPRVLICDDEEGVRESLALILQNDYDTVFSEDAAGAIDTINNDKNISAMFLDIKMPDANGLDVLKELKKSNPALPVIVVTGYESAEMVAEAIKLGAKDYILKPINSDSILSAIKKVL